MEILFFRSTWGMDLSSVAAALQKIKAAGFDGVEIGVPATEQECGVIRKELDQLGLHTIVQQWTAGVTPLDHARSLEAQYHRALLLKPLLVNSHTGKDWFSLEDNLLVFDFAAAAEKKGGVPLMHETHRGRALFSAPATMEMLRVRPELKLTADFSHWCCVHESLLEDQTEAVQRAITRSYHIHARIGHSEGPQIPHPRAPEWSREAETHLGWWKEIVRYRSEEKPSFQTICVEFGPPPYLQTLPFTGQAVSDLWQVNTSMRDWLRERLGGKEKA